MSWHCNYELIGFEFRLGFVVQVPAKRRNCLEVWQPKVEAV